MENHKIDRLFQDKLSRHESDPSPAAWEAINAQIIKDKRPMIWLRVAASVALVAAVGWLIMRNSAEQVETKLAYFTPDQPTMQAPYVWDLPIPEATHEEKRNAPIKKKVKQPTQVIPSVELDRTKESLAQQEVKTTTEDFMPDIEPVGLEAMALTETKVDDEVISEPIQAPPGVGVQITYKATPPSKVDEKSRIERLWAKAKEIKPGEVLADIRDTKNDFFNGKKN